MKVATSTVRIKGERKREKSSTFEESERGRSIPLVIFSFREDEAFVYNPRDGGGLSLQIEARVGTKNAEKHCGDAGIIQRKTR